MVLRYLMFLAFFFCNKISGENECIDDPYGLNNVAKSVFVGDPLIEINLDKYLYPLELQTLILQDLAVNYDHIVKVYTIGESAVNNRTILAVRISHDVQKERLPLKPMFKFVARMHGDDDVGYAIMVSFIQYLVYSDGFDPRITSMLNTTDIWIVPNLNPDAPFYENGSKSYQSFDLNRRNNGNGVDLDQDFPWYKIYDKDWPCEPETQSMLQFISDNPFVLSGNLQGGAIVASYPFDYVHGSQQGVESLTPDSEVFEKLARDYAAKNPMMAQGTACNNSFSGGITNGNFWRKKLGGMQDANYILSNCFEISLYVSCCKYVPPSELPKYWAANLESMLSFIENIHQGIYGIVMDRENNPLAGAVIKVEGINKEIKGTKTGEYWRLLVPGFYNVTVSAPACEEETKRVNLTETNRYVRVDFFLFRLGVTGRVTNEEGNPVKGAVVNVLQEGKGKGIVVTSTGEYGKCLSDIYYDVSASAFGYITQTKKVILELDTPYQQLDFVLRHEGVYGRVIDEKGSPVMEAVITMYKDHRILRRNKYIRMNENGEFWIKLRPGNLVHVTACAPGYSCDSKTVQLSKNKTHEELLFQMKLQTHMGVHGEVKNEEGIPVTNAVITVRGEKIPSFQVNVRAGSCLRNVKIHVPLAVIPGHSVTMMCHYDLEGDPLYTVKWYKSRQEFFRYVPKELPHTRVFPYPGINVDVSQSGSNQVVLRDVQMDIAGKYRCEVSADAPNFHTGVVSSNMHVVQLDPEEEPKLLMEKPRYSIGDTLRGNCTSPPTSTPANITWLVNEKSMNASYVRVTNLSRAPSTTEPPMYLTQAGIELEVSSFQVGKLRIQCTSQVFQFKSERLVVLDEERPQLASVLGTRGASSADTRRLFSTPRSVAALVSLLPLLLIKLLTGR